MPEVMIGPRGDDRFLLSATPPDRAQKRLALWILLILAAALCVTAPFARISLADTQVLVPGYAAAVLVNELITATLLLALFSVQRSYALLALAIGYLLSALLVVPWALTFPGVFAPSGLLDAGLQSTATIAALRRIGFPLCLLAYALLRSADAPGPVWRGPIPGLIAGVVIGLAAAVGGLVWLIVRLDPYLPAWMIDHSRASGLWTWVSLTALALCATTLTLLWRRGRSVLDLWLMVVIAASIIEILLLTFISAGGRLSLGWWAGRLYGLTAASVVLIVLLSETTTLYARLVRSALAERREREARLTAMEAMSASIAHEVNQPLASMVTNADAGLRWLDRETPDLEEARAALGRIVGDGHRAGTVIRSVRTLFRKNARDRVSLDMNTVIREALDHARSEAWLDHVALHVDLDDRLPTLTGDPVQLRQVIANLIANGLDAMSAAHARPRTLRVMSEHHERGTIRVSVEDSGAGVRAEIGDQIFEPFFTTKSTGMGMGLMICRSIVEAHGGRLWMSRRHGRGALFRFTLPAEREGIDRETVVPMARRA